ncbi:penicillin-binding transpeptidase domain-containing protein [Lachnospiraceae bacterium 45-W7]
MSSRRNRRPRKRGPARFSKIMKKKLLLVFSFILLLSGVLVGRLVYIDQVKGEEYEKQVLSQQSYGNQSIPYQRGEILDTKGTILATNEDVYNVILDCKLINEKEDYVEPTIAALVKCFPGITEEEVRTALAKQPDSRYYILCRKLHYSEIEGFQKLQAETDEKDKKVNPNVQGVWFEKEYKRVYPYNSIASKVLGFTTSGNEGIGGLEDYYNDTLNGINGRQYGYLNTDNNVEKTIKEPVNGNSLVTTIDLNVQKVIEEKIAQFQEEYRDKEREGAGSEHTGVLVMNPQNGEILGMSDNFTYDLNNPRDLSKFYTQEEIAGFGEKGVLDKLNDIWQNFCITYTYEPGSTAKPFTVATGLETGKIKDSYYCDGVEKIGGYDIKCINRSGHGMESTEKAVMDSCNDALMQMAADIGKEDFYKYQNIYNFGLRTNIDLPGETRTDTLIYTAENTNATSLATNAFGQNFNVTMVQLATAFSSLINGGYYYQPHLVKKIVDDKGNTVQTMETTPLKQTISKQTSDKIKSYLYKTVSEGTGRSAKVEGYSMGGKTGTAEKGNREDDKYVVSFIGFAPVEEPQVLVYVVIDEANVSEEDQSSALATALAKKIFTEILPYINIFKDEGVVTPEEGTEQDTGEHVEEPQQEGLPDGIPNVMPDGGDGTAQEPEDFAGRIDPQDELP